VLFRIHDVLPLLSTKHRQTAKQTGFGMNEEAAPATDGFFDGGFSMNAPSCVAPDLAFLHERVSFDELEKVRLDVDTHDTVRFDHGTCLAVDVVPRTADLGLEPTFEGAKQIGKIFTILVWAPDPLELRQVIEGNHRT
jgi:hypothetical protein